MAEIPDPPQRIARLVSGESLADTELDAGRLVAAGQDVRAYYEEAGLQLADVTGADQLQLVEIGSRLRASVAQASCLSG